MQRLIIKDILYLDVHVTCIDNLLLMLQEHYILEDSKDAWEVYLWVQDTTHETIAW